MTALRLSARFKKRNCPGSPGEDFSDTALIFLDVAREFRLNEAATAAEAASSHDGSPV
jgi:hypothetical protein